MPRYLIRRRLSDEQKKGGVEGASGTVIYAESSAQARAQGATKLGVRSDRIEVIEYDDPTGVFGEDRPLTKEEADEWFNQGAAIKPGSWEPI